MERKVHPMVIRMKRMRAAALLLCLLLAVACLSSCVNGQGEGSGTARAEGNLYGSEAEPLSQHSMMKDMGQIRNSSL